MEHVKKKLINKYIEHLLFLKQILLAFLDLHLQITTSFCFWVKFQPNLCSLSTGKIRWQPVLKCSSKPGVYVDVFSLETESVPWLGGGEGSIFKHLQQFNLIFFWIATTFFWKEKMCHLDLPYMASPQWVVPTKEHQKTCVFKQTRNFTLVTIHTL